MYQHEKVYKAFKQHKVMTTRFAEVELEINSPSNPIQKAIELLHRDKLRVRECQGINPNSGAIYKVWKIWN